MLSVSVSDSLMFQVYLCCSIDATNNARLGRYMNDAPMRRMECNCLSKACYINKKPHLLVFAARDIQEGEELRYDYGTGNLPWRIKNPDSATVVTSASDQIMSENPNKQQSVSVENPVASTSGAKSASENPKKKQNPNKQQSVSVESQVASTADGAVVLNSTFNTIEAGLYYVHPQTGILHPYEEMEDADEFPLRDDDVEYFGQSAPLVSFQF